MQHMALCYKVDHRLLPVVGSWLRPSLTERRLSMSLEVYQYVPVFRRETQCRDQRNITYTNPAYGKVPSIRYIVNKA
jgi:hypothetical protein